MQKLSVPARASLRFTLTAVLAKAAGFLTTPIFTRLLSPEEYGLFPLFAAWVALLTPVATLAVGQGVLYRGFQKYGKDGFLFSAYLFVFFPFAIVLAAVLLFPAVASSLTNLPVPLLPLAFLTVFSDTACALFLSECRFRYAAGRYALVLLPGAVLSPLFGILLIFAGTDPALGRIYGTVIGSGIGAVIALFLSFRGQKPKICKEQLRFIAKFQFPLLPHCILLTAVAEFPRLALSHLAGQSSIAVYSLFASLSSALLVVGSGATAAFSPWVMRKLAANRTEQVGEVSGLFVLLFSGAGLLTAFAAPEILRILAPQSYLTDAAALSPLLVPVALLPLDSLFLSGLFRAEKPLALSLSTALAAALALPACWFLTSRFGVTGAAVSRAVGSAALTFSHGIALARTEGLPFSPWRVASPLVLTLPALLLSPLFFPYGALRLVFFLAASGALVFLLFSERSLFSERECKKADGA